MIVKASGSATFNSSSAFSVTTEASLSLKASSVTMDSSGLVNMKGSQITLEGMVYLGAAGGTPALTLQTQMIGIGNLGAPVVSTPIGPFATKVFLT